MDSPRQVGPFEIIEPLGAGGMGEVFKARDQRLNRLVALKFLPEAAGPLARERFQREALAIAALNHPHICTLHEVGDDGGRPYLVLELLEGESLKMRLRRGPLAPEQVLDWGLEIAEALDAAHHKGVLHRDLKPDNLWVTTGGHIKVLDFGLARLELEDPVESATIGADRILTSPGVAMGTIPYMSPEQAKGEPLDARSDIFSFGSVFYEMASGRLAFPGRSAAETSAAILKDQPPRLSTVRPEIPPKLEDVTNRCLEKDPELRYQSAADLRGELKRLKRESGSATHVPTTSTTIRPAPVTPPRRRWLWPAVVAVIVIAAGSAFWWLRPRAGAAPPQLQFRQLTFSGHVVDAVISPDGKFLAHVDVGPDGTSLHLVSVLNGSDTQIMPPAKGCCQSPSFSPDGSQVYFREQRALMAVPVLGGAVRTIAEPVCSGAGFSPDGTQIAYITEETQVSDLVTARADGTAAHVLNRAPSGQGYLSQCWANFFGPTHSPAWSPDGRSIAVEQGGASGEAQLLLVSTSDGRAQPLGPPFTSNPADFNWLPDGHGLVATAAIPETAASQLWEVAYPSGKLTQLTNDLQGYAAASLSSAGTLALVHAVPQASIWVQSKPGGEFQQLPGGGADQDGGNKGLDWTPQGGLVSVRRFGDQFQLWTLDADGGNAHELGALPASPYNLHVAANGQIVFGVGADTATVWRINGDGSGLQQLMPLPPGASAYNPGIALGGRLVEYMLVTRNGDQTLWGVPLAGGAPRQLWNSFVGAGNDPVSPDGTRVLLVTRDANLKSVPVIVRLDGGTPQVSPLAPDPATAPVQPFGWTPDGRASTFLQRRGTTDNIWALPIQGGKAVALTHFTDLNIRAYRFSRDGRLAVSRGSQNRDVVLATGLAGGSH